MASRRAKRIPQEPVEMTINALSHEGRGIASVNGKTTFVFNALPGETVLAQYTQCRGKFDEADAIEILKPSTQRIVPKCAVFGVCGGCSLQHMSTDDQLVLKQKMLAEQFQHFGQVVPKEWLLPLTAETWGYRQKARLGVRYVPKKGGVLVGFRERGGRFLTDMGCCEVMHPSIGEHITLLREFLDSLEAKADIPQLEIAIDDTKTAVILRHLQPLSETDIEKLKDFATRQNWWLYLQPKGLDSIHLLTPEIQDPFLEYALPEFDITIQFRPEDFTQVNTEINHKMVPLALELLDLQPDDNVLDLFCGLGNFTLPLARRCKFVVGVEGDEAMTTRAMRNAKINHIDNVQFHAENLFEEDLNAAWLKQSYEKILLDPPRAGAEAMMHRLKKLGAKRVVYVSCNPATLARDVGILVNEYGYRLEKAGVMDMFPHTSHVESIALLTCD